MTVDEMPPVRPTVGWRFPAAEHSSLPNGLRVLAYRCRGQYVVNASLLFDVPLDAEPRDLEGVAGLTGRCLTAGAAGRSAEEFADALAICGADMEAAAFSDGFAVRVSVPVTHLGDALTLLADAVTRPSLAQDEFEHEQRLRLQEIAQARAYPGYVANERLNAELFGELRAARPAGGDVDTVSAVTREDVADFVRVHLSPSRATLIIAGDFGDEEPAKLAHAALGGWSAAAPGALSRTPAEAATGPRLVLVDWPDAPQATLRVACPGITRADPRWPALFVANYAVGGNFSSRVNTVLREQKGFTYGASSSLDTTRTTGILGLTAAVRSDATAEALSDIIAILRGAAGSITDDEVATGIRAATDSAALGYERADAVVGRVEMLVSQDLPLDHVDANLQRIREVTTRTANQAYADVVHADALTAVVVGDAAALRKPLTDWGYADLQELPSALGSAARTRGE